jgi:hypothetical protein
MRLSFVISLILFPFLSSSIPPSMNTLNKVDYSTPHSVLLTDANMDKEIATGAWFAC